jgi:hypothetical protein
MTGGRDDDPQDRPRRGYRYRPADAPATGPDETDDDRLAADVDEDEDDDLDAGEEEEIEEDEDGDEPPSEFWPAAEILKGATITDAELELSYSASVYVNTPAAEMRLWLRMPDGSTRLVQIDEPHAVWLYRQAHPTSDRDFEEYPDHRFELPSSDLRVLRARQRRQLIDRQMALHEELVAIGEELEELDRDTAEDEAGTADWPGTRWP